MIEGTLLSDGSRVPLRVCGFAFTELAIDKWIKKHNIVPHVEGKLRLQLGWGDVFEVLKKRHCEMPGVIVRVDKCVPWARDTSGNSPQTARCIVMGTNRSEGDMDRYMFSRRRMEEVHEALFCVWGTLGKPTWYDPI